MFKKAIIQTNDNLIKLENALICYWNSCPDCFGFKTSGINRYQVIWLYVFVGFSANILSSTPRTVAIRCLLAGFVKSPPP